MGESYGRDSEGAAWAEALTVSDFEELVKRFAQRDIP
jgi:hypothetical protein